MIGLSLSFCIRDILRGDRSIQDVEKIIAGTFCICDADWENLFEQYYSSYWSDFSRERALEIFNCLRPKIQQSRLHLNKYPIVACGHWVNSESDIEWRAA